MVDFVNTDILRTNVCYNNSNFELTEKLHLLEFHQTDLSLIIICLIPCNLIKPILLENTHENKNC